VSDNDDLKSRLTNLRHRAEAVLDKTDADDDADDAGRPHSARELIHELRVAQVELELQNDELRGAQDALEHSRRRYEALFQHAPVGYVVLDRIGIIQQVNEQFREMVGRTDESLHKRSLRSLVDPEHVDAFDRRFPRLTAERGSRVIEARLRHADEGRVIHVRLEGTITHRIPGDEDGRLMLAVSDVTEAKALEKQLWESQKLETVGHMAGGIAHDFNNALTVIQSTIDVARLELDPRTPQDAFLRQIESATTQAAALVQQLLAFAHRGVAVPRVMTLHKVLAPAHAMLRRLLPESIELEWAVGPELHRVNMDPVQVDQILTNLVLNARDAVGDRGAISITCRNVELDERACLPNPAATPGAYVAMVVRDDGVGMADEVRERVFEPFFTTKGEGKGSGLGLSTVYGIVIQNSGLITVESAPGEGSCFTIYLPRAEGEAVTTAPVPTRVQPAKATGQRILLVEDNKEIMNLTRRLLMRRGYRVDAFPLPSEARAWFDEDPQRPDLVLCDVVMPEMNGPDLVDGLTAVRPDLPCVFMSGYTKDEITSRRLRSPDTIFLTKPFDSVTLLEAVQRALGVG
jgi:two-component system cell cycle sensor histidine kinase/response regulator CckA